MSRFQAGEATIPITLDDSPLRGAAPRVRRSLQAMQQQMERVARAARNILIIGGGALAGLVKIASDVTETLNRFEQVFKDQAEAAEDFAETFGSSVQRTSLQLKESLTTFQSFFVGLGFANSQARDLSQTMTTLAVDFASFNNVSDDEAVRRFISALAGSPEVLDKFGVNIRESVIEQELLRQGIEKTAQKASEQEKAIARLNIIMRAMTDQGAVGDAERTADQLANTMRGVRGELVLTAATIGAVFTPAVLDMLNAVQNVLPAIRDWVTENDDLVVRVTAVTGSTLALAVALPVLTRVIGLAVKAVVALRNAYIGLAAVDIGTSLAAAARGGRGALVVFVALGQAIRSLGIVTVMKQIIQSAVGVSGALVPVSRGAQTVTQFLGGMIRSLVMAGRAALVFVAKATVLLTTIAAFATATAPVILFGESWDDAKLAVTRFLDKISFGLIQKLGVLLGRIDENTFSLIELGEATDLVNQKLQQLAEAEQQVKEASDNQTRLAGLEKQKRAIEGLIEAERQRAAAAIEAGQATDQQAVTFKIAKLKSDLREVESAIQRVNQQKLLDDEGISGIGDRIKEIMASITDGSENARESIKDATEEVKKLADELAAASRRFEDFVLPDEGGQEREIQRQAAEARADQRRFLQSALAGADNLTERADVLDQFRRNIEAINQAEQRRLDIIRQQRQEREAERQAQQQDERDRETDRLRGGLSEARQFTLTPQERQVEDVRDRVEGLVDGLFEAAQAGLITPQEAERRANEIIAEGARREAEIAAGRRGQRQAAQFRDPVSVFRDIQSQLFNVDAEKAQLEVQRQMLKEQQRTNQGQEAIIGSVDETTKAVKGISTGGAFGR